MTKYVIFFCCCFFAFLSANAQFFDDFSDSNFTENPQWNGTNEKFTINNFELQLNDVSASGSGSFKAYLSTNSAAVLNAVWSFKMRIAGDGASATNYARFYLVADNADLTFSLKGFYVMIGGADKKIFLYKQNGTTLTKLIESTANRVPTNTNVFVKVERDNAGNWKLFSKNDTETEFTLDGEIFDDFLLNATYSGIYVNYSSTRKDKFFFDDFSVSGEPYIFVPQVVERNDVIINEIMADPDPPVALPAAEYIELYNRTNNTLNLAGWTISCGSSTGTIAQGEVAAGGYILLCSANARENFVQFGNTAQVISFPTLTNSAGLLVLKDAENQIITAVNYSDKWFGNDSFKKDGGFSLEKIDAENLNNSAENWQPSFDVSGGTPCRANSVKADNADEVLPQLLAVSLLSDNSVELLFNKEMNENALKNTANYFSEQTNIISAATENVENKRVAIIFSPELTESDTIEIFAKNLRCVSGFSLGDVSFRVAKPQEIAANDLVINELLFHTTEGVSTFVEIFNKSGKVADLSEIFLTRHHNGGLDAKKTITTEHILLFPQKYLLLTDNISSVCNHYDCDENALKIECVLPSLPNTEGNLVIIKANAEIIDEFFYSEKMHQKFTANPAGVSLERINPYASTQEPSNWHSASFDVNYGTPSRQNSQYFVPKSESEKNFWLEYETFTPDNDGYRDNLFLNYKFSESGFSFFATIYDAVGHKIRTICNNAIAGTSGQMVWNGLDDNGSLCAIGVYVVVVEAVNLKNGKGTKIKDKIVCVLSMK